MNQPLSFTPEQIADITGGYLTSSAAGVQSIPTDLITADSRQCAPGSLYVAKRGEHTDGHRFVSEACAAGAVLTMVEREVFDENSTPFPSVIVQDALTALGVLAAEVLRQLRQETELTVIAITGSVGKTTTKDVVAQLCAPHGPTVAAERSFNGEIGVPMTIFRASRSTRYLVLEMGARHRGEISYLTRIAPPDIAVVLCVGTAHIGEFGGIENIVRAKREIFEALPPTAVALLNADDPRVCDMAAHTRARTAFFGFHGSGVHPLVSARNVNSDEDARPHFELVLPHGQTLTITSEFIGVHHIPNLLAAAAVAWALHFDPLSIQSTLSRAQPLSQWRMERTDRDDGITIINDAFNANPDSMKAALQTLIQLARPSGGHPARRAWAVLGAMYELGPESARYHHELAQTVVRLNVDQLLVVGEQAKALYNGAVAEGSWGQEVRFVTTIDEAYDVLVEQLHAGDIVLLKSSRDAQLRHLGERLVRPDVGKAARGAESEYPSSHRTAQED